MKETNIHNYQQISDYSNDDHKGFYPKGVDLSKIPRLEGLVQKASQ